MARHYRAMDQAATSREEFRIPEQEDFFGNDNPGPHQEPQAVEGADHQAEFEPDEGVRSDYASVKFGYLRKTRGKIRGEDWAPNYSRRLQMPIFVPLGDQQN